MKKIFLILIILFSQSFAQDTTKSEAFKKNPFFHPPVFKPKYRSYPLVAGYLLMKDAKSGDPFAEHELGLRYLLGKGFPKDTAKAIYWIKKAAAQNLTTAHFNLGIMLLNGVGVKWNPFKAFKHFEYAAKSGMPEAEYIFATFYLENLAVNRNYAKAYFWLKRAAKKKNKEAIKLLKRMKESGIVFLSNFPKEADIDTSGNVTAINYSYNPQTELLNSNYELSFYNFETDSTRRAKGKEMEKLLKKNKKELFNRLGVKKYDSTKAKPLPINVIREAASYGSPNAYRFLGKFYEYGVDVKKDTLRAVLNYLRAIRLGSAETSTAVLRLTQSERFFKRLKKLTEVGNSDAEYVWAALTALNFSFQITKEQALKLLKKAAEHGSIPALIELGAAYFNGATVKKNPNKAQEYWGRAVKKGSKEAEVRIAFASVLFAPKNKNLRDEILFLKEAAEKGSVPALNALGFIYEKGISVKKNEAKAAEYYRRAYYLGDQKAYDALRSMYDEIRPKDKIFEIYDSNLF